MLCPGVLTFPVLVEERRWFMSACSAMCQQGRNILGILMLELVTSPGALVLSKPLGFLTFTL